MGINVDQLREGLSQYNDSLQSHLNLLKEDFDSLKTVYGQFASEYEGQAAEQFKAFWESTAAWFESYMDLSEQLSQTLEERVEKLKNV